MHKGEELIISKDKSELKVKELSNPLEFLYFSKKRRRDSFEKEDPGKSQRLNAPNENWLSAKYLGLEPNERLLVAVQNGNVDECRLFVNETNVNYIDNKQNAGSWKGRSALYLAVDGRLTNPDKKDDFEEIISLLVKNGADLKISCLKSENTQETTEELIERYFLEDDERKSLLQLLGKNQITLGY